MLPVNTALCSFGMSGIVFHAPFIHLHPGFNLYGIWERTKDVARQKYPEVKIFRSLEELLADDAVELVVVNTPNYTHFDYARQALEAGKHVVIEKPFAATSQQAAELIQLAQQKNVILSVFHNRRNDSDFKTVQQVIQQGWLGEIVEAEIHYDRYKIEPSPKEHKEIPRPGTGLLYDLGPHIIDQALVLFGSPEAVFADVRALRPSSQVDDCFDITLYYSSLRVKVKSSLIVREPLPSYIIHGREGSFIKSRADVQEATLQSGIEPGIEGYGTEPDTEQGLLHTEKNGEVIREKIPTLTGNYMDYYNGIYKAIREDQPVPVNAADALTGIKIIEAAYNSSKERKAINLE